MSSTASAPLNDTILIAVSELVDDSQTGMRRDPSHYHLDVQIARAALQAGDPKSQGQTAGKAKRVAAVLSWALENDVDAGGRFVHALIANIRGHGGFRDGSSNYVGAEAIENAIGAFQSEGYELTRDGDLRTVLLDSLSGVALTDALKAYIRRAKRGADDAALVTGTGKDLLEATAAHILQQKYGGYSAGSNFPTLLGQTFVALGLATPADAVQPGEPPTKKVERSMFELACALNTLRNKQGTGHGRPWLPTVTEPEARAAVEHMGVIAERLLAKHEGRD